MENIPLSWIPWAMQERLVLFLFAVKFLEAKASHVTVTVNGIFCQQNSPNLDKAL